MTDASRAQAADSGVIPGPALFYCRTPLQAMIANALVPRVRGRSVALYHPTTLSPKHRAYFEMMTADERHFVPYAAPKYSDTLTEALTWARIPSGVRRSRFASMLVASVGSIPFGMLAVRNPHARVYTFDDGTFNLSEKTYPRWISHEPRARRAAKLLLRAGSNPGLTRRAYAHFTIFPARFVVGEHRHIEEVDVFGARAPAATGQRPRRVRVLLGSWFSVPSHQSMHDRLVASGRFDLFLPHPADGRSAHFAPWLAATLGADVVRDRIAEDVVNELHLQGLQPVVFGFDSTALYNLSRHTTVVSVLLGDGPPQVPAAVAAAMGVRQVRCRAS